MASDFAKEVRELWAEAEEADKKNREEALADLKFAAGEHWDDQVREYRERQGTERYGFPLPCLTINTMPQYIGQVVGDRRANEVAIKVLPNEEGDKQTAEVRSELIRSIEVRSKAQRVYMSSFGAMVNCGVSNFRIALDYAYDDAFERDLFVRDIPNPLGVLWDPRAADPTGKDAEYCFVHESIAKDEFKRRFKDAKESDLDTVGLKGEGWAESDSVRFTEYWKIVEKQRTLAMLQDGSVQDVTDKPESEWQPMLFINPTSGKSMVRKAPRKFARMVVTNGHEELDDPFEVPLCRLPIIRVSGQEMWIGEKRVRFGLTRFARDPARLKDYWRSVVAEMLMLAPRANYMADAASIAGREDDWPNTLVYNDGAAPPTALTQQHLAAMMREAEFCSQDMRDATGIHEADLGMQGNEKSGIAIQRRQQQGDIATIVYHDAMNAAQQEAGEVLNELLPVAYDTARTIRLIGQNEAIKFLEVNNPENPDAIDLSKGRYDVTISTGPAYMTKRQEASSALMELASKSPRIIEVAPDLVIKSLDIPDGDELAERLKRTVPPEVLGDEANEDKSPEELQQQQQAAEEAQQLKKQVMELELREKTAKAEEAEGKARKAHAEADSIESGVKTAIEGYNAETGRIKAVTAKDFPLSPEMAAQLAPLVGQIVMQALNSPDVLPGMNEQPLAEPLAAESDGGM